MHCHLTCEARLAQGPFCLAAGASSVLAFFPGCLTWLWSWRHGFYSHLKSGLLIMAFPSLFFLLSSPEVISYLKRMINTQDASILFSVTTVRSMVKFSFDCGRESTVLHKCTVQPLTVESEILHLPVNVFSVLLN